MKLDRIVEDLDVADVTIKALVALRSGTEKILATYQAGGEACYLYVHDASDVRYLQNHAKENIISDVQFHIATFDS